MGIGILSGKATASSQRENPDVLTPSLIKVFQKIDIQPDCLYNEEEGSYIFHLKAPNHFTGGMTSQVPR